MFRGADAETGLPRVLGFPLSCRPFPRRRLDEVPRPARVLPESPPRAAAPSAGQAVPAAPLEQWNNLFAPGQGMKLPSRLPSANGKGASQAPRTAFVLVGTIVSSSPDARRAILWANGMKLPKAFREGEEVEPGRSSPPSSGTRFGLPGGRSARSWTSFPWGARFEHPFSARSGAGGGRAGRNPGGRHLRPTERRHPREPHRGQPVLHRRGGVAQLTGNINQFMTQVRLIPFFEGNKSAGYRIAAIRPGTTFERLGFQGGDVLQQVNGLDVSSPRSSTPSSRT